MGGACQSTTIARLEESAESDVPIVGSSANAIKAAEMPIIVDGCTNGECIAGMLSQQSCA